MVSLRKTLYTQTFAAGSGCWHDRCFERRVCPKGEPSAVLHLCHQRSSQATHRLNSSLGSSVALRRVCRTRPCGDAHSSFLQTGLYFVSNAANGRFFVRVESDHRVPQPSPFCMTPEAKMAPEERSIATSALTLSCGCFDLPCSA